MKIENNLSIEILQSFPLFSELSSQQLNNIASISKILNYKKNEIIFREGDPYKGFFILLKGSVKIYKISFKGKESILHLIKPSESFGDVPLFDGGSYPVTSETIVSSSLVFFPADSFKKLIRNNPIICFNMLIGFAKKMRRLTQKVEELSTKEVTNRLARYFLEEIKKAGTENLPEPFVKINLSKKNISSYLGTIPDTLSRVLKKLQDEKIIRISGKTIFVCDFRKLKLLAR
ncbi:MAG: Crp/Fnr family transcriptional regulator [Bacteroidota bacterium]